MIFEESSDNAFSKEAGEVLSAYAIVSNAPPGSHRWEVPTFQGQKETITSMRRGPRSLERLRDKSDHRIGRCTRAQCETRFH